MEHGFRRSGKTKVKKIFLIQVPNSKKYLDTYLHHFECRKDVMILVFILITLLLSIVKNILILKVEQQKHNKGLFLRK